MAIQSTWLFILFVALQIADAWLTIRILTARSGRELNPIMRWLFEQLGLIPGLVAAKLVLSVIVLTALPWVPVWLLVALCVFYAGVVASNWHQLRR
ncbi:DUF5658 family protein [Castellaniella sp. S9]|uniref:DUF5658 family protein n=1 Tax=Castellaniella sp. S9 TaxID=2993652 RepID=UPI0022B311F1|nr:DUF5658 family protein [Castellaniella sp. S9]